ncbi:MAG: hypothetical protein JWM59_3289 [Verrucomicrobiales bacterium]|nr:hypothetical protein [Verrucomicrobiales bacterium]
MSARHSKSTVDFKAVNERVLASAETLVLSWLPGGKRAGAEWVCGDRNGGPGRSLSVNLHTGMWSDFSLDGKGTQGGDLVSLLAHIRGCTQLEAAAEIDPSLARSLNGNGRRPAPAPAPQAARRPVADWTPIIPVPDTAPEPPAWLSVHKEHGPAVASWQYRTQDKSLIGYMIRFNREDSRKDYRPVTWCEGPDGKQEWRAQAFREPRPLYGLEFLHRDGPVYICEGEKATDALRRILPDACVMTWPGGSNAVAKADWSPLAGRDVIIWPDADEPGTRAALAVQQRIPRARIATPPAGKPKGWDAADAFEEGWTEQRVMELLEPKPEPIETSAARVVDGRHPDLPFRMLGTDGERYYYFPDSKLKTVSLSPLGHVKLNLFSLAPDDAWKAVFPKRDGFDEGAAANALMQWNAALPAFNPSRVRGRGCWIDGGDVVFHAGGHLRVNGKTVDIRHYTSPTGAIYERGADIPTHDGPLASNMEGARLIELCRLLPLERPVSGLLLAGWVYLAVICGAMHWRPHLWVTGTAGSGKSWTAANILAPLLGEIGLSAQGSSTEAGLRGELKCDARPVIFDEAESEDAVGQARMAKVIEFARQSSSGSGAGILKGTATGGSVKYTAHAAFLFLSIGVAAVRAADTSRITVLNLRKSDDRENFKQLQELCRETAGNPEWVAAIRARAITNALTIRKNVEVFSAAAATFTGDRRSGDQLGTLLGGAWSLMNTQPVTPEAARDYVAKQDLSGFLPELEDSDESQCYSHLMNSLVTLGHGMRVPVGELVAKAKGGDRDAQADLKRNGMKVEADRLWIANRHPQLELLFRDTPWAGAKWGQQFARMPGAQKMPVSKFGSMCTQRSVSICLKDHD